MVSPWRTPRTKVIQVSIIHTLLSTSIVPVAERVLLREIISEGDSNEVIRQQKDSVR